MDVEALAAVVVKQVDQPSEQGRAHFWFHEDLRLFLSRADGPELIYHYQGSPSIKDAVEACGVPHVEVGLILVDGRPTPFNGRLNGHGSRVQVFPPNDHPPVDETLLPPPRPPGRPVFVLDVHLGVLARFLRMLGFDSIYEARDLGDARLARIAGERAGIMLSRDIGLLKRGIVRHGYFLRSRDSREQLREVVSHFGISWSECRPFSRCLHCNDLLAPVAAEQVADRLPESVRGQYDEFHLCGSCDRIYWKGTHYLSMREILDDLYLDQGETVDEQEPPCPT